MEDLLNQEYFSSVNYFRLTLGIILLLANIFILNMFYEKFSNSNENKTYLKRNLPLFGLSIFLIISVIKTSLALSLGLVGALSIIRFRTAIKEQEQIINYLLVMAISIAIAAEKEIVSIIILLFYLIVYRVNYKNNNFSEQNFISINIHESDSENFNPSIFLDINSSIKIISISKNIEGDLIVEMISTIPLDVNSFTKKLKNIKHTIEIV